MSLFIFVPAASAQSGCGTLGPGSQEATFSQFTATRAALCSDAPDAPIIVSTTPSPVTVTFSGGKLSRFCPSSCPCGTYYATVGRPKATTGPFAKPPCLGGLSPVLTIDFSVPVSDVVVYAQATTNLSVL